MQIFPFPTREILFTVDLQKDQTYPLIFSQLNFKPLFTDTLQRPCVFVGLFTSTIKATKLDFHRTIQFTILYNGFTQAPTSVKLHSQTHGHRYFLWWFLACWCSALAQLKGLAGHISWRPTSRADKHNSLPGSSRPKSHNKSTVHNTHSTHVANHNKGISIEIASEAVRKGALFMPSCS